MIEYHWSRLFHQKLHIFPLPRPASVPELCCLISHKKRKDGLKTRAKLAVLRTYVEKQAILEPILLYLAPKCKQTKEQGSEDCLWTYIFTFL